MGEHVTSDGGEQRWRAVLLGAILAGILLRVVLSWPAHKYAADGDALLAPITGQKILAGERPVFYSGVRLGALESYAHALVFSMAGSSRASAALVPTVTMSLFIIVFALLAREIVEPRTAALSTLLMAIPSPAFAFWTYMPNGYPEIVLLSAAVILLAVRIERSGGTAMRGGCFGLLSGLAVWCSIQSLGAILPSLWWILSRAPRQNLRRTLAAACVGAAIGGAPLLWFNVTRPLGSLENNYATRPASSVKAVLGNGWFLASYGIPEITVGADPENGANPPAMPQRALQLVSAVIHLAAIFAGAREMLSWIRSRSIGARWGLLLAVAATGSIFVVVSSAGQSRGLPARYYLLLYLVIPVLVAMFAEGWWRRGGWHRTGAVLMIGAVLAFHLSCAFLPGTAARERWRSAAVSDEQLIAFLREAEAQVAIGFFWEVYPINFLSQGQIDGVPFPAQQDHYGYANRNDGPRRWVFVSQRGGETERWAAAGGVRGRTAQIASYFVFVPETSDALAPPSRIRELRDIAEKYGPRTPE